MAFQKAKALQEAEKSVAQGKITQAIRQYQVILDNDPSDISLLNTVGDLYIRDRNITEGLRQFHRLAEGYVREGFNVKAIAIYRKISKVDPNSIETLLKLADLYQLQGLSREAREQYLLVADFFRKRNQWDRVLEVLHKLVQLDPESINFRQRLGAEFERAGKLPEASAAYLEAAEISLRRDDQAGAEPSLQKAAELDPKNSKVQLLLARKALTHQQPEEAARIINSLPALQKEIEGKRILLDAYLGLGKIAEAGELAAEVFTASPTDFAPVSNVAWLLAEKGEIDAAFKLAASVAGLQIAQNQPGPILEVLHRLYTKTPGHIPTLELMLSICERTSDEYSLTEVLEGLGRAQEQAGNMEKAEAAFAKLVDREPDNEKFVTLLNAVQQKLGREITPLDFSSTQVAMVEEEELPPTPQVIDAEQEVMVREALENSDLFSRYNLSEKAIAELEKVLEFYPDQIEIHRRILEISRKGYPQRGAIAAAQLARIFRKQGDEDVANKYQEIASAGGSVPDLPLPSPPPVPKSDTPAPFPSPVTGASGSPTPAEFPLTPVAPQESRSATPPAGTAFSGAPWEARGTESANVEPPPAAPPIQPFELDLSDDLDAMTAVGVEAAAETDSGADDGREWPVPMEIEEPREELALPPHVEMALPAGPAADGQPRDGSEPGLSAALEDSRIEVEFYLENGFLDEARQSIAALEVKYPGSIFVAGLRQQIDVRAGIASSPERREASAPLHADSSQSPTAVSTIAPPPAENILPATVSEPPAPPFVEAPIAAPPPAIETPAASTGQNLLGDLAGDLDASFQGFAPPPSAPSSPSAPPTAAANTHGTPVPFQGVSQLSGLLAEMEESGPAHHQDDPETHYNLGVAFREMGLLDESIGEFQKVVRGAGKGNYPPNFLQACSLLAICFMEKKMPALAVRWYKRALETPDLDEEALMALQYDMGVAYELSGDCRSALERYTEVYSQNIDFRDVAEKIRELQQKV